MSTFEEMLDLRQTREHKDGVTCALAIEPWMFNSNGVLHGGVIATVADEAAWWTIVSRLGKVPMTTAELKINYLRAITGKRLTARGTVLKLGRMLCVTRVDILDERRRLCAHASVTYALLPNAGG